MVTALSLFSKTFLGAHASRASQYIHQNSMDMIVTNQQGSILQRQQVHICPKWRLRDRGLGCDKDPHQMAMGNHAYKINTTHDSAAHAFCVAFSSDPSPRSVWPKLLISIHIFINLSIHVAAIASSAVIFRVPNERWMGVSSNLEACTLR